MEHLDKNGSFLQRKKMYVAMPFHSLNSKVSLDWSTDTSQLPQQQLLRLRQQEQQRNLRMNYEARINRMLQNKYVPDTYRAIPNQLTLQRDRDTLEMQLQQFNQSKIHTAGKQNSFERSELITDSPSVQPTPRRSISYQMPKTEEKEGSQERYDLMKQYRQYAEKYGGKLEMPFKNAMPDKLENFLREKTKADRQKALQVSLSLAEKHKNF